MKIKQKDKLRVYWSKKEHDLILYRPLGVQTSADAWFLSGFFNQELIDEMKRRGYDITTLKFEISPQFPTNRPDKFKTLNEKYINNRK